MDRKKLVKKWTDRAKETLVGRTIVDVRYEKDENSECYGVMLKLDNGMWIYPMQDDEGNDVGSLHTNDWSLPVIPII